MKILLNFAETHFTEICAKDWKIMAFTRANTWNASLSSLSQEFIRGHKMNCSHAITFSQVNSVLVFSFRVQSKILFSLLLVYIQIENYGNLRTPLLFFSFCANIFYILHDVTTGCNIHILFDRSMTLLLIGSSLHFFSSLNYFSPTKNEWLCVHRALVWEPHSFEILLQGMELARL